jgi:hypothetical protein
MRHTTAVLGLCAALAAVGTAAGPPEAAPQSPEALVARLGSAKYTERERAARELEAIGPDALPALRAALDAPDPEVRRRAALLVRRLEDRQWKTALVDAKPIHLRLKDATLAEAVAELSRQSGNPLVLDSDAADRRVTLDTGDTTFWDALAQLGKEATLMDYVSPPTRLSGAKGFKGPRGWQPSVAAAPVVVLTPGRGEARTACVSGAFRIRVLHATPGADGEIELVLEVAAEPRLLGACAAGDLQRLKVVDDGDHVLPAAAAAPLEYEPPIGKFAARRTGGLFVRHGNILQGSPFGGGPLAAAAPFQLTAVVQVGDNRPRRLKVVSGTVLLQLAVDDAPRLVIEDLPRAAGHTVRVPGGSGSVFVQRVETMPSRAVRVELTMANDAGKHGAGHVILHGAHGETVEANGVTRVIEGTAALLPTARLPRLLDAAGKPYLLTAARADNLTVIGSVVSQDLVLLYRPQVGHGPPFCLAIPGSRPLVLEVPFVLRDVSLP